MPRNIAGHNQASPKILFSLRVSIIITMFCRFAPPMISNH